MAQQTTQVASPDKEGVRSAVERIAAFAAGPAYSRRSAFSRRMPKRWSLGSDLLQCTRELVRELSESWRKAAKRRC